MRALMSMLDAMPARSPGTAPVVVLVTDVLVSPRPVPASRQPGKIVSQLAPFSLTICAPARSS